MHVVDDTVVGCIPVAVSLRAVSLPRILPDSFCRPGFVNVFRYHLSLSRPFASAQLVCLLHSNLS